jgi:hypothetical protein
MWANHGVIGQHINREIDRLANQYSDSAKALLASQAKRFSEEQYLRTLDPEISHRP